MFKGKLTSIKTDMRIYVEGLSVHARAIIHDLDCCRPFISRINQNSDFAGPGIYAIRNQLRYR